MKKSALSNGFSVQTTTTTTTTLNLKANLYIATLGKINSTAEVYLTIDFAHAPSIAIVAKIGGIRRLHRSLAL